MTRLRIGIDGYNLAMPRGTGVATYGFALARALTQMGHGVEGVFGLDVGARPDLREILFFDLLQRPRKPVRRKKLLLRALEAIRPVAGFRLREVPVTGLVEKDTFESRMPAFDRIVSTGQLFEAAHAYFALFGKFVTVRMPDPPEIMHWTYPVPVRLAGARNIYTLHDMVPLRLPYTTLDVKETYYKLVKRCIAEADHICTVSNASLTDITDRFPIPPERLTNTYQASPVPAAISDADPADDAAMIEGIFGLRHRGYFLYFGAIEPKKNIGRLIEAYLTTRSETPLVIVGARAWESEQELALLGSEGSSGNSVYGQHLSQRIIQLDYLPRRLLLKLARGARAVTFPSLYEGFGLPVHEAMLLGTPVLTTRTSSLPEVAGDAALLVDPYDVDAIAQALIQLDSDAALRVDLGKRGLQQAALFSEARYRDRLSDMYRRVLASPKRKG